MFRVRCIAVPCLLEEVIHGTAVGSDESLKAPGVAKRVAEQHRARAGGHPVHRVVSAHQRCGVPFGDSSAKGRQVGIFKIVRRRVHVEPVPLRLRPAVDGEVLGSCNRLQIHRIRALQTLDEGDPESAGEERVFAIRLLPAAPAWIAKDVDVRGPDRQPEVPGMHILADSLVVLGTRLGRDHGRDLPHQSPVPCGGHPDRLGKHGRISGARNSVQPLTPPIVLRHAKPGDRRRRIHHLRNLLFQRHARDKVRGARIE